MSFLSTLRENLRMLKQTIIEYDKHAASEALQAFEARQGLGSADGSEVSFHYRVIPEQQLFDQIARAKHQYPIIEAHWRAEMGDLEAFIDSLSQLHAQLPSQVRILAICWSLIDVEESQHTERLQRIEAAVGGHRLPVDALVIKGASASLRRGLRMRKEGLPQLRARDRDGGVLRSLVGEIGDKERSAILGLFTARS